MNYIRADYAIQRRNKNAQTTTLRVVIIGLAIITVYWLLSSVQPIPAQACTVQTYDGSYTQC